MRRFILLAGVALAACSPETPKPVATEAAKPVVEAPKAPTEAEAVAVINQLEPLVFAKDVTGIVGLYTDDAVLVDMGAPDLVTTRAANEAATKSMTDMNVSKMTINERHVQVLDADTFVNTMIATLDATPKGGKPMSEAARVTDVYQKQASGKWLIVNEHISAMPAKPKAPLAVVETFAASAAPAPAAVPAASAAAAAAPAATGTLITEAEANALVDKLPLSLLAKDAAGMAALFTDGAVVVDAAAPALLADKAANLAAITDFMKSDVTKVVINARKTQVLDANDFVSTAIVTMSMKPGGKPATATARVTDVFHKGADGNWLIVNEHMSAMPTMPKIPLPVVATYPAAPAKATPAATATTPVVPAATAAPAKPK